jgi:transcriptional regulator with GAF, ATPase, and Fis domain
VGGLYNMASVTLVGRSDAIRAVKSDIECAAKSDAKVLVTGETGVGKEVVARMIHQRSSRRAAQLVTVNCAGLPDSLLESELFGHVRGSFTGAYRDKPGLLEMAPNGTVFMDEVGEMSMRMQAVLLRFLETGEIQRIGADRAHTRVNVRLITATNRHLQTQIAAGAFREDLYFRLNVFRLIIPPLRERLEDIPLLIDHFLAMLSEQHNVPRPEISPAAMEALLAHVWPGNIRELKNVLERILLRAGNLPIRPSDLPADVFPPVKPAAAATATPTLPSTSPATEMTAQMLAGGESFWSVVYPAFMARDLTRNELRAVVRFGLRRTNGNYRSLVNLFNMAGTDYKRFLSFLRKHECHVPFQEFRAAPPRVLADSIGDHAELVGTSNCTR